MATSPPYIGTGQLIASSGDISIYSSDAPHSRCMAGVWLACNQLAQTLPEIFTDTGGTTKQGSLILMWDDLRTVPPLPCIVVTIEDVQEEEGEDDGFEVNGVVYPVNVLVLAREGWEDHSMLPMYLLWRHKLMEYFRDAWQLAGVPECVNLFPFPKAVIQAGRFGGEKDYNMVITSFSVKAHCTLNRVKPSGTPQVP